MKVLKGFESWKAKWFILDFKLIDEIFFILSLYKLVFPEIKSSNISFAVSILCDAPCANDGGNANNASPDKKTFL